MKSTMNPQTLCPHTVFCMPDNLQEALEPLLEADLSAVRIHVGHAAVEIGALAFASGCDVYFAPGCYDPATPRGLALLAHELTHVIQQQQGRVSAAAGLVADPVLEAEADRAADRVVQVLGGVFCHAKAVHRPVGVTLPSRQPRSTSLAVLQAKFPNPGGIVAPSGAVGGKVGAKMVIERRSCIEKG